MFVCFAVGRQLLSLKRTQDWGVSFTTGTASLLAT